MADSNFKDSCSGSRTWCTLGNIVMKLERNVELSFAAFQHKMMASEHRIEIEASTAGTTATRTLSTVIAIRVRGHAPNTLSDWSTRNKP